MLVLMVFEKTKQNLSNSKMGPSADDIPKSRNWKVADALRTSSSRIQKRSFRSLFELKL